MQVEHTHMERVQIHAPVLSGFGVEEVAEWLSCGLGFARAVLLAIQDRQLDCPDGLQLHKRGGQWVFLPGC